MPENTDNGPSNGNETGPGKAKDTASARGKLRRQLKMFGTVAAMAANQGFVKTARVARPLIHGYTGCDDDDEIEDDFSHGDVPPNRLTPGEKTLLMNAGAKLAFETIELATLAYPPAEGIEPYRAVKNDNGCYPAPHLAHVLSLGRAVQDLFGDQLSQDKEQIGPTAELQARQPVLLTALNGNEYGYLTSPIEPRTIRRVALGERNRIIDK